MKFKKKNAGKKIAKIRALQSKLFLSSVFGDRDNNALVVSLYIHLLLLI